MNCNRTKLKDYSYVNLLEIKGVKIVFVRKYRGCGTLGATLSTHGTRHPKASSVWHLGALRHPKWFGLILFPNIVFYDLVSYHNFVGISDIYPSSF